MESCSYALKSSFFDGSGSSPMAGPFGLPMPSPGTATQRRDSESPPAISVADALACVAAPAANLEELPTYSLAKPSWCDSTEPPCGVPPIPQVRAFED
jgi:hypothetical protein